MRNKLWDSAESPLYFIYYSITIGFDERDDLTSNIETFVPISYELLFMP